MAAKDLDFEATEPMEEDTPDIDQPDEDSYMSLEQVLNDGSDGEADDEEGDPAPQDESGSADRNDGKPQKGFRTQAEFDRAFGQRAAGLRKQWEREHAEEFALAEATRRRYGGKSAAEIEEAIILDEARELSVQTGYSEEEAVSKVRARHEYDRRTNAGGDVDPKLVKRVAEQMDAIQEKHGIDLQAEIEADNGLLEFVAEDGDLRGVLIEVQARRLAAGNGPEQPAQPKRKSIPKPETSGAARSASTAMNLSDSDVARIDAMVQRGKHVRLD